MKRFILSLIVILGLVSCETKSDNLSTSLVNNPSSADGVKSGSNAPAIRFETTCMENPMDRGAWRTTVHRVTKSVT